MSVKDKNQLIELLTQTHLAARETLGGVDLTLRIYTESGWRVRDIVGHLATWDQHTALSLRAYQTGSEYLIPDYIEDEAKYNQAVVLEQQKLSDKQILEVWEKSYEGLRAAVQEMPEDRFPGDMLYPWGDERGSIIKLVEYFIEHTEEHREEIVSAVKES